jgi:hypothetical protein
MGEPISGSSEFASTGHANSSAAGFAHARFNTQIFRDEATAVPSSASRPAAVAGEAAWQAANPLDGAPATPAEFLRRAEREARWRSPGVRAVLGVLALLLAGLLALQWLLHHHDQLAATQPGWREPLAQLCELAGCRLEPPLRLEALSVETSALTQDGDRPGYRLGLTLRNRAPFAVAAPALDLSLTDSQGQLLARRVITPADWSPAGPTSAAAGPRAALPPGTETPVQVWLSVSAGTVAGYNLHLFYP